jgi:hypothetical protein
VYYYTTCILLKILKAKKCNRQFVLLGTEGWTGDDQLLLETPDLSGHGQSR